MENCMGKPLRGWMIWMMWWTLIHVAWVQCLERSAVGKRHVATFPIQMAEITEPFTVSMLTNVQFRKISVPDFVSSHSVLTSYAEYRRQKGLFEIERKALVLLHGFDSSSLEFRRLVTQLADTYDVYAPDILGWGFSGDKMVKDYSPDAKLQHLRCFIEQVVQKPCTVVGASLGGGIGIQLAVNTCPNLVSKLVLLDAQGFVDGQGKSNLPKFVGRFGISILKARWLRQIATKLSYYDKSFATEQAVKIGSVHCFAETWDEANLNFLLSGGFVTSPLVPKVTQPTLVIWGESDEVINISNAYKFVDSIPSARLEVIKECGHVPHIEKYIETANLIKQFVG